VILRNTKGSPSGLGRQRDRRCASLLGMAIVAGCLVWLVRGLWLMLLGVNVVRMYGVELPVKANKRRYHCCVHSVLKYKYVQ
jgi:hypothetical protein